MTISTDEAFSQLGRWRDESCTVIVVLGVHGAELELMGLGRVSDFRNQELIIRDRHFRIILSLKGAQFAQLDAGHIPLEVREDAHPVAYAVDVTLPSGQRMVLIERGDSQHSG